jgi:hypothetical protein
MTTNVVCSSTPICVKSVTIGGSDPITVYGAASYATGWQGSSAQTAIAIKRLNNEARLYVPAINTMASTSTMCAVTPAPAAWRPPGTVGTLIPAKFDGQAAACRVTFEPDGKLIIAPFGGVSMIGSSVAIPAFCVSYLIAE